uniref:Proline and serine rich 2 n=1 Tax=Sphaeramia orbicularis TaxID=375764 RepID=A0A673AGB4_9TELE
MVTFEILKHPLLCLVLSKLDLIMSLHIVKYFLTVFCSQQQDEALQFLSPAEQECLQFFEETIDSLEESLEQDELRPQLEKPHESSSRRPVEEVDGPPTSSPKPGVTVSSLLARATSAKDHDIIDLVRPEPDLPRRDPMDTLPSEYNPPLPSGSYGPDSLASYHPPGCIPTPVLIAQKIAENQAGPTSSIHPSVLLRRCSLESEKSPSQSADLPVKHGPPTSAKPTRFPANISVILGNKEHQNESLANVNIQERRAQMLANLTGTSHPLLQEDPQQAQKERNTPTRRGMSLPHNPLEPLKGSRTFNPSAKLNPPADSPARTSKVPAPTPAPRPPRHSYHGIPTSVPKAQRAPSPDHRRRPASMFRPQGITVQFSGRGATDESRREALRRLGLLKDS